MTKYAALIRGIGPGDPQKTNEKLRSVIAGLGFTNVQSVITSGNIVFESDEFDIGKLETMIESAWENILGFNAATVVRSQSQLEKVLEAGYFDGLTHSEGSYLLVTFFKKSTKPQFTLPHQPEGKPYKIVGYENGVLYSVTDNSIIKTSDLMTWLERQFTKDLTSRTPLTIERIVKRMKAEQ